MDWKEYKKELMNDPEFAEEHEALRPEYEHLWLAEAARRARGLDSGKVQPISAKEFRRKAKQLLE